MVLHTGTVNSLPLYGFRYFFLPVITTLSVANVNKRFGQRFQNVQLSTVPKATLYQLLEISLYTTAGVQLHNISQDL